MFKLSYIVHKLYNKKMFVYIGRVFINKKHHCYFRIASFYISFDDKQSD